MFPITTQIRLSKCLLVLAGILYGSAFFNRLKRLKYRLQVWWLGYICFEQLKVMEKMIHQGRNVKRFREMLGIKQEALAFELGEEWNQRKVSVLEGREVIEPELLADIARVLKVPVEAIKTFDEEAVINIISNTINNHDNASGDSVFNYYPTINPVEKWMEALEENKRLYEMLLKEKDEKIMLLEKIKIS
jgi:transcriptional regulator with XRE-family HTH domain